MVHENNNVKGTLNGNNKKINNARLSLAIIGGGTCLLIFIAIMYWGYHLGMQVSNPLPVIEAKEGPVRVAPDDPGGVVLEHQDKQIYSTIAKDDNHKYATSDKMYAGNTEEILSNTDNMEYVEVANSINKTDITTSGSANNNHNMLEVVELGNYADHNVPSDILVTSDDTNTNPLGKNKMQADIPDNMTSTSSVKQYNKVEPKDLGWRVQLAAVKSKAAAEKFWNNILKKHSDIIGSPHKQATEKATISSKLWYRIRVVPYTDDTIIGHKQTAEKICKTLKEKKMDCIVVRK